MPLPKPEPGIVLLPARVREVRSWVIDGMSDDAIMDRGSRLWNVRRSWVDAYLTEARRGMGRTTAAITPDTARAVVEGMLKRSYETALDARDSKGMVAAAKAIGELHGVLGTVRAKTEESGDVVVQFVVEPKP